MRFTACILLGVTFVFGLGMATVGAAPVAAELGAGFSDLYREFAPLYLFYRSYGDHLFHGTSIEIPSGLGEACEHLSIKTAMFQIDVTVQTASDTLRETVPDLIRLRIAIDTYCAAYGQTLSVVAAWDEVDEEAIERASDAGLFSEIRALSDAIETTLDVLLEAFESDVDRWIFGVAFSMRGILTQTAIERMDANLNEILYGSPDAVEAPIPVSEAVAAAMARLIELSGRDLTPDEAAVARAAADVVYRFVVDGA